MHKLITFQKKSVQWLAFLFQTDYRSLITITTQDRYYFQLHGLSRPDKAKFVECSIISLALSFWMKHRVIGQLQRPAKFSDFH